MLQMRQFMDDDVFDYWFAHHNYQPRYRELQSKASSARGRNELIQATNQLLGFLAEDAMKLRQLQMMQAQMAGTAYEAQRARTDLSNKRIEAFFKRGDESAVDIPGKSIIERLGN